MKPYHVATLSRHAFSHPILFFGTFFIVACISYALLQGILRIPSIDALPALPSALIIGGVIAGFLQLLGYLFYIWNEDIDPNPVTWFMFAYGTFLLTILEWDGEATVPELLLPAVCTAFAIYVSFVCWRKARAQNPHKWWPEDWWPEDRGEQISFVSDIGLTLLYLIAWSLAAYNFVSGDVREYAVLVFLFLSNVSTFPAFYPIIRETLIHPEKEHWVPWAIWAAAYAVLGMVTFATHGAFWHALMFYPVANAVMHGLMAIVATGVFPQSIPTTKQQLLQS